MSFENLIGTAPNQIPSNSDLGDLAYQNRESVNIAGGTATLDVGNIKRIENTTAISEVEPTLLLDFAKTKTLDPRITFVRASTGAYYDGKTHAKAEENLLLYSQEFDNAYWSKSGVTITAESTTAPDGTSTADFMAIASGSTSGRVGNFTSSVVAGDYVISAFAKPNGKDYLVIYEELLDGTVNQTWFNVSTGTIGTTDAGHTAVITDAGNGWFRCSVKVTANASRTDPVLFRLADTNGSTTVADDGNGLYLWGAQLEQRSAVTAYTPTTTQPITNYIPALQTAAANTARFGHDPTTGESLGLLIEEGRTNLLTYSEDFTNAAWSKGAATITSNTIVAPDGTLTGDKLIADTTTTQHFTIQSFSKTEQTYTGFVFAKRGELRYIDLGFSGVPNFNGTPQAKFDLELGEVNFVGTSSTATIEDAGNGWYKCILTSTSLNTVNSGFALSGSNLASVPNAASNLFPSYTGDGYSGIYIWGAQLEEGAFPTSYIKTEASQVTRSADSASMTGANFSSWYRQDEGTAYCQLSSSLGATSVAYSLDNGGISNEMRVTQSSTGTDQLFLVRANGVLQATISGANALKPYKSASAFKTNDFSFAVNGILATPDVDGILPTVNQLKFGSRANNTLFLNGYLSKFSYYPKRLSNEELQEMTE